MTITPAELYWITRPDKIHSMCTGIAVWSFIGFGVCAGVGALFIYDETLGLRKIGAKMLKSWPRFLCLSVLFGLSATFAPTTKEMAAILVIPQIASSEKVREAGGKLYDLAVEWMDALRPKDKEAQ